MLINAVVDEMPARTSIPEGGQDVGTVGGMDTLLPVHSGKGTPYHACESEVAFRRLEPPLEFLCGFIRQKPYRLKHLQHPVPHALEGDAFKRSGGEGCGLGVAVADPAPEVMGI